MAQALDEANCAARCLDPAMLLAPHMRVHGSKLWDPHTRLFLANFADDLAVSLVVHDRLRHAGRPAAAPAEKVSQHAARARDCDVPADRTEVVGPESLVAAADHDHVVRHAAVEQQRPLDLPGNMCCSVSSVDAACDVAGAVSSLSTDRESVAHLWQATAVPVLVTTLTCSELSRRFGALRFATKVEVEVRVMDITYPLKQAR